MNARALNRLARTFWRDNFVKRASVSQNLDVACACKFMRHDIASPHVRCPKLHSRSMFSHPMPNTYVAKRHFFASRKVEHDASDNDDIDTKEVADLVRSLEEDKDTENLREIKFPGIQRGEKMVIIFTCTVCNTRTAKTISKIAYNEGVVIARCPGCQSLHLVADRLNYFSDDDWDIEKFLNERGDDIKLIDSDDKLLQIQLKDIVGGETVNLENEEELEQKGDQTK